MTKTKKVIIGIVCFILVITYCIINDPQREVTLTFGTYSGSTWDVPNGDSYKVIEEAIAQFEKKYPNVTVNYESGILKDDYSSWLSKKIVNGEQPDVFLVEAKDFNTYSSLGVLKNLNSFIDIDNIDTRQFYQGALQAGQVDNNQYALPYETNPTLMCINRDLLEKEGIAIPDDSWTIEDFYNICQQVTKDTNNDGVIDQFGYYGFTWQDAMSSYGNNLFDENGTKCNLSEEATKDALYYMQKLRELSNNYQVSSEDFDEGNVAFCPLTLAQYRTYQPYPYRVSKYSTFDWSCIKMPGTADNDKTTRLSTSLISINSQTSHTKYALEFLKMLTIDEDIQQELFKTSQGLSPLKSVLKTEETNSILGQDTLNNYEITQETLDIIMENTITDPKFKEYNSIIDLADYYINNAINNNSIDSELYNIQKQLENELNNQRS